MDKMEREALDLTAQLWNKLNELPVVHPEDLNEARFHIHAIQNMIYAREAQRRGKGRASFGDALDAMLLKK